MNQLTQTLTRNYKVSFTYDTEGLRTSKNVNGEKTVFVWDGDQLVMELSKDGKVQKRYVRGIDLVYADKGDNTEKQYYVTDPHGNVVQLTDESGIVVKIYEYDSFGNELKLDVKDDNPFRYCGEYYDKETEEIYLRARYYQPVMGRFLTRDTYTGEKDEPESLHLYTYCGNDGVNAWDPSGHFTVKEAVKREIKGMTKYKPDTVLSVSNYNKRQLKAIVEERVVKTWSKKKNKNFKGVDDFELLARTLYFESSQNDKAAKTRRNEIVTFYKVVKARMESDRFTYNTMRDILLQPGQFCGLTYFTGKKPSQRGYAKIKINKEKINLSWVRAVVVATVAERKQDEKYTSKLKYPDDNDYYYWHSIEDWKKFTNSSETKIKFVGSDKYYKIKVKKRYSDTYFYDVEQ